MKLELSATTSPVQAPKEIPVIPIFQTLYSYHAAHRFYVFWQHNDWIVSIDSSSCEGYPISRGEMFLTSRMFSLWWKRVTWPVRRLFRDYQIARLIVAIILIWIMGAAFLRGTEGCSNQDFNSLPKAFWNIAVYLFSGMDSGEPQTASGRIGVVVILVLSAGVVAIFTGTIASLFVEHHTGGRRRMPAYELKDHILVCNWNEKGLPMIRELHARVLKDKRPIVVISEEAEAGKFPDREDAPEFEDVYLIKGDPASDVILKRANVQYAHSVVVLADPAQGNLADAKSILICMGVCSTCEELGMSKTHISVEGILPENVAHLRRAGADEIVCAGDFGMMLLAQSVLAHGLSTVYRNLLTVSEETNEIYLVPIPRDLVGKNFAELGEAMFKNRNGENPVLLLGLKSGERIMLNPRAQEHKVLKEGDQAVVIALNPPSALF